MLTRFSRLVLRHKLAVVGFWLTVLIAGIFAAPNAVDRLSDEFNIPDEPSYQANAEILQRYGNGADGEPLVPVVTLPADRRADDPGVREQLARGFAGLDRAPAFRTVSYASTGDEAFVTDDGRTVFGLVFTPHSKGHSGQASQAPQVREVLQRQLPPDMRVRVTGLDQLAEETGESGAKADVLVETLVGGFGALLVLVTVFGSLLAVVPLLVAGVSILSTFLAVLAMTLVIDVNFIVQFLVALIGLGVAIDYSLLLVTRWREECARGRGSEEAVGVAMRTAGRAVAVSGGTVALGLFALVLVPVEFIQSMGYAGVLIPLASVAVTLSLLPVLLAKAGRRLDWPRRRTERNVGRLWTRWATGVARHPWIAALAALVVLVPLVLAALGTRLGNAPAESLPGSGAPRTALHDLGSGGVPSGVLTPIEVLVPPDDDPEQVARAARGVDGVYAAASPQVPDWQQGGTTLVEVLPVAETTVEDGQQTVERVREVLGQHFPAVQVGGSGAQLVDAVDGTYSNAPWMLAVIVVATFVLLTRAFRSVVLAAQAVVLNLLSIGAAFGAAVLIWQHGYGSELIWDIQGTGAITFWVPLLAFAFLYGLSMDYEVFLLSRIRETYEENPSTTAAVVNGLGRVGRLVTSAALILFLAFASLASTPQTEVKILATTLGVGILLDATVLRALLVPSLVSIGGRWNWWLPRWAAFVLRVPAAPLPSRTREEAVVEATGTKTPVAGGTGSS